MVELFLKRIVLQIAWRQLNHPHLPNCILMFRLVLLRLSLLIVVISSSDPVSSMSRQHYWSWCGQGLRGVVSEHVVTCIRVLSVTPTCPLYPSGGYPSLDPRILEVLSVFSPYHCGDRVSRVVWKGNTEWSTIGLLSGLPRISPGGTTSR